MRSALERAPHTGTLHRRSPHSLKSHCSPAHLRIRPHHGKYFWNLKTPLKVGSSGHILLALKRKFISYHFLYKLELLIRDWSCKIQASLCPMGSVSMENALPGFKTNTNHSSHIAFTTRIPRINLSKPPCGTMIPAFPSLSKLPQTQDCIAIESGSALHHVS